MPADKDYFHHRYIQQKVLVAKMKGLETSSGCVIRTFNGKLSHFGISRQKPEETTQRRSSNNTG